MPTRFGKYWIDQKIAVGGMAEIYKARTSLGEPAAIKVILPHYASQAKFVQMFLDEAKIVLPLKHPNIVQLFDFGKVGDTYFFSMEWVDGKALSTVIRRQLSLGLPFPVEVALRIGIDVCDGLSYAHTRVDRFNRPLKIVHRDISPPNILIGRDGVAKVADFGIADAQHKAIQTQPGIIRGKFSYMSPEQAFGGDVDARSDVFSLGIIFYEALTGRRLFLRDVDTETILAVRKCDIPFVRTINPAVSRSLEEVLRKALSKDPDKRFASAEEFGQQLRRVLETEYPDSQRRGVAEFLKVLFPHEQFPGLGVPTDAVFERWRSRRRSSLAAPLSRKEIAAEFMTRHRWPVTLVWAFFLILMAEVVSLW